jgi:nitric oxide reductase NorD protein
MSLLEKNLKEKIGAALIEEGLEKIRPILGPEGTEEYLQVVDLFVPFDEAISIWLLRKGEFLFGSLSDPAACREILQRILAMGKAKWSVSSRALKNLPSLSEMERTVISSWLEHGQALAEIDQDAALQFFNATPKVLDRLGLSGLEQWALLGQKIDPWEMEPWARLGILLIEKSPHLKTIHNAHSLLAVGASAGKSSKVELAIQYFRSSPQLLARLSIHDLDKWVHEGLADLEKKETPEESFFSLQTGKSRKTFEGLVQGLELNDNHSILHSYAEVLTGEPVLIRSSALFYANLPGLGRFFSITDGIRIYLPSRIAVFNDQEWNFKIYKSSLAHELSHLLFDTFTLPAEDLAILQTFRDPSLAFALFEFLEDERVDSRMEAAYPGLAKDREKLLDRLLKKNLDTSQDTPLPSSSRPEKLRQREEHDSPSQGLIITSLKEILPKVRNAQCSPQKVLALALDLYRSLEKSIEGKSDVFLKMPERLVYRGVLDFELVEKTRKGMSTLLSRMMDRLEEKKREALPEEVEEALHRIEASDGLESEPPAWALNDQEKMEDLFENLLQVLSDIEAERNLRRTEHYDEWDRGIDDYKKEWCRVREMDMPSTSPVFYNRTIDENYGMVSLLRRHFGLLRPDRIKRFFREERGDDIDYDALIESIVERAAGRTPSDRVYIRREKNLRDVSVAFLVDMSYSTGDVLPSGKRIIDVEREGLVLMAEALESIGDAWAVYGFSTHYRDKVDFFIVRDFDMPFTNDVKMRFENIRPLDQTRLGAAIRHATRLLQRQGSRIRLLILLSDGRPYDIDYGDADYAVEDTRRALWEGRRKGINSFCITVDKKSRDYLPYMYGEANYTLIEHLDALPVQLPLIYKRLTT